MRLFAKIFAGGLATEPLPAGSDRSAAARDGGTRRCGRLARQFGARLWERVGADEVSTRAAALAYYFIFALFPALLFLTALLGLLPVPGLMERLLGSVTRVLPPESAALVRRTLGQTLAGASTSLLSLGALGALWAAAAGMVALIDALNVAHGAVEARSWWARRLVALILTVGLALFVLTALVSVIFGERVGAEVAGALGLGRAFTLVWGLLRWPLVVGGLLAAVLAVYHSAPAASPPLHRLVPGSACAVAAWLLTSSALRVYVAHFGSYDATYGSIGGVIVLMLWFYLSSLSLLVGAEINMLLWEAQAGRGASPPDSRRAGRG
jgi:membrane protein